MKNEATLTVRFWLESNRGLRIEARWTNQSEVLEVRGLKDLAEYLLAFDEGFSDADPSEDASEVSLTRAVH
jgi:hypothetical protein